jgi:hypothetical protein
VFLTRVGYKVVMFKKGAVFVQDFFFHAAKLRSLWPLGIKMCLLGFVAILQAWIK